MRYFAFNIHNTITIKGSFISAKDVENLILETNKEFRIIENFKKDKMIIACENKPQDNILGGVKWEELECESY